MSTVLAGAPGRYSSRSGVRLPPAVGGGGGVELLGSWPLTEASGTSFNDATGTNDASLAVPSWTAATHEHRRKGIVTGLTDFALEVSNGGPSILMIEGYQQSAMSLALWVCPLSELRGRQYWDESDARHGREILALCDPDGPDSASGTAGAFCIERRWNVAEEEHRLDGYVRAGDGTRTRFSGGLDGLATALLPVDTSKQVVLTQGADGAELWLDGTKVADLPSVTAGWADLSGNIDIGCWHSSDADLQHANHRSPFWGRVQEARVYQGQLTAATSPAIADLPAALQSRLWHWPSDFDPDVDINIADHSANIQAAIDAANTGSLYVYQDTWGEFGAADTTFYSKAKSSDAMLFFKPNCKGLLGLKLRKPSGEDSSASHPGWWRMIQVANTDSGQMGSSHGDLYAGTGGWKFIGLQCDGNGRNQNWVPRDPPGSEREAFHLEQAHAFYIKNSSVNQTLMIDACQFHDGTGDAMALGLRTIATVKSNRFFGYFRGAIVVNEGRVTLNALRNEMFVRTGFNAVLNGTGLNDIEPFVDAGQLNQLTFRDSWYEQDFDDENEGSASVNSFSLYYNCHATGPAFYLIPSGNATNLPTQRWEANYCTFMYHKHHFNYPPAWWKGFPAGDNGLGCLFDHTAFVACGDPYVYHESAVTPVAADVFRIHYESAGGSVQGPRLWTQRDCEWRVKNLPGGIATANVQCVNHTGTLGSSFSVELTRVLIDAAFADQPFALGGVTVVNGGGNLHERTSSTTPWSGAA